MLTGWVVAGLLFGTCLIGDYKVGDPETCPDCYHLPSFFKSLYDIFVRDMFAVAVSWMIFACCTGYGGTEILFTHYKFVMKCIVEDLDLSFKLHQSDCKTCDTFDML